MTLTGSPSAPGLREPDYEYQKGQKGGKPQDSRLGQNLSEEVVEVLTGCPGGVLIREIAQPCPQEWIIPEKVPAARRDLPTKLWQRVNGAGTKQEYANGAGQTQPQRYG